jgi:hypothetical protein
VSRFLHVEFTRGHLAVLDLKSRIISVLTDLRISLGTSLFMLEDIVSLIRLSDG